MDDPIDRKKADAATQWAIGVLEQVPTSDREATEAHITSILLIFWGALWGTFGEEYATGFIESQLHGMKQPNPDTFVPPARH